jgi:hypothetical protein
MQSGKLSLQEVGTLTLIADCGFPRTNPHSAIRNPQSGRRTTPIARRVLYRSHDAGCGLLGLVVDDETSDYGYNDRSELTSADHNDFTADEGYGYEGAGNRETDSGYTHAPITR